MYEIKKCSFEMNTFLQIHSSRVLIEFSGGGVRKHEWKYIFSWDIIEMYKYWNVVGNENTSELLISSDVLYSGSG